MLNLTDSKRTQVHMVNGGAWHRDPVSMKKPNGRDTCTFDIFLPHVVLTRDNRVTDSRSVCLPCAEQMTLTSRKLCVICGTWSKVRSWVRLATGINPRPLRTVEKRKGGFKSCFSNVLFQNDPTLTITCEPEKKKFPTGKTTSREPFFLFFFFFFGKKPSLNVQP